MQGQFLNVQKSSKTVRKQLEHAPNIDRKRSEYGFGRPGLCFTFSRFRGAEVGTSPITLQLRISRQHCFQIFTTAFRLLMDGHRQNLKRTLKFLLEGAGHENQKSRKFKKQLEFFNVNQKKKCSIFDCFSIVFLYFRLFFVFFICFGLL